MVVGALEPSLSRGILYQSMRWFSNVLAFCSLLDIVTGAGRGLTWGARGRVAGWAGRSGVLAPCSATAVAVLGHLASICDLGVNFYLLFENPFRDQSSIDSTYIMVCSCLILSKCVLFLKSCCFCLDHCFSALRREIDDFPKISKTENKH